MIVKNLSQFKREIKGGRNFKIIEHFIKPECNGEIRIPSVVQTNGFYSKIKDDATNRSNSNYGKGIWIEYDKAKDYIFNEDGTIIQKGVWKIKLL